MPQLRFYGFSRSRQQAFDSLGAAAHCFGHLVAAEALEVPQDHRQAVIGWQGGCGRFLLTQTSGLLYL